MESTEKPSRALNVHLGDLKHPWLAYCERIGRKPGAVLKEAVEAQLRKVEGAPEGKGISAAQAPRSVVAEKPDSPGKRIEIRLRASEREALQGLAELEGCSAQQWIVNVVRGALTHQPQFGMRELAALGESNYQLLAIGRSLNQIARRMNEGQPASLTLGEIEEVRRLVTSHTQVVSAMLRASTERWSIK